MDDVRTKTVKVGGRTFELAFSVAALIDFKENIPDFDYYNFDKIRENISNPKGLIDVLYILAKWGCLLRDKELDVSKEWLMIHIPASPQRLVSIQVAILEALSEAMAMEAEEDEDNGREVDVALEEIQKKSEKTD